MSKYVSLPQQRVLRTLDVLFGHEVQGLSLTQVSKLVGTTLSNSTRDLANLREAGYAEQIVESGNWRITPRIGQRALAILHTLDRETRRLDEIKSRYTRTN